MITRRHALRLIAAAPAVVPVLTMSPQEALAELDRAITDAVPEKTDRTTVYDPVSFAERVDGIDWGRSLIGHAVPQEMEVTRIMHALQALVPALTDDLAAKQLFSDLSDAVYDWAGESAWSGLRAGAAYENLRLALMEPYQLCPECLGMFGAGKYTTDRAHCPSCGGRGMVPTPGVRAV